MRFIDCLTQSSLMVSEEISQCRIIIKMVLKAAQKTTKRQDGDKGVCGLFLFSEFYFISTSSTSTAILKSFMFGLISWFSHACTTIKRLVWPQSEYGLHLYRGNLVKG